MLYLRVRSDAEHEGTFLKRFVPAASELRYNTLPSACLGFTKATPIVGGPTLTLESLRCFSKIPKGALNMKTASTPGHSFP
ncbi:hypothetical protein BDV23DRAFT_150672 [Aspergillus alliaceus]|uniref:Uncharacterized protein n=1 Tax=Petromyces alliaceus TaxID=209559 RepID=A0A5N7CFF0_PETAA|nr:hypothetical protein BDV23DRAFT_150672 [Aspergillus alliaceus]